MKLFEHTQQTTHSDVDLKQLKDIAIETLHESSRYIEVYYDTTAAIGLLKRLEAQGGSNSPVMQLAYESINDQLGYEEGTRLSVETVGGAIIDFGKRMWDKVIAAWEAVKEWSAGVMDRLKVTSSTKGGDDGKVMIDGKFFNMKELASRYVIDTNKPDEAYASFDHLAEEYDFLDKVEDFIFNSNNLRDVLGLLYQSEYLATDFNLKQTIPLVFTEVYRSKDNTNIGDQIIDALEGEIKPIEVVTLEKTFIFSKGEVDISDEIKYTKRTHWNFKENNSEIDVIMTMFNDQTDMVVKLQGTDDYTDKIAPIIAQVTKDMRVLTELLKYILHCRSRIHALRMIVKVAQGK